MSDLDVKPVSYIKSKLAQVLNHVNDSHQAVLVTQNGEVRAVLQDYESYSQMKQALAMLKLVSQSESDVNRGAVDDQTTVFSRLESRYLDQ